MKLKEKITRGAAAGVVAGTLSIAMLAGQAAPANAILPIIPVVAGAVGGTAAGAAVSGWALAGYAALTGGVLWASMAIQENGSVWFDDLSDFLTPDTGNTGKSMNSAPNPNPSGSQPPKEDGAYLWYRDDVVITNPAIGSGIRWDKASFDTPVGPTPPLNRVTMDFHYNPGPFWGPTLIYAFEAQCKSRTGGAAYSETTFHRPTSRFVDNNGDRDRTVSHGCSDSRYGELTSFRLRPPTTAEKRGPLNITEQTVNDYDLFAGPAREYLATAPDNEFEDPGYRATVECVSSTGVKSTLSLDSAFSTDGKVGIPSCKAAGLGDVASSLKIDFIDGTRTLSPAYKTLPDADVMLECDPAFGNVCNLEIYIDGLPCVVGTVQCAGWISQHQADPSRVKCFYGSREVSISNCGVLEGAYVYGGSPLTRNNTDGDPATWDDPQGVPFWIPQPGPNGEPAANPNNDPDPDVTPNPNVNPDPGPENSPSPSPSPSTPPQPEGGSLPQSGTNPGAVPGTAGENCLGSGWSWNPVSWVMVPVQCALEWAFVPPKARIDAAVDVVMPKLELRGINPFVIPLMTSLTGLNGSGCSGPAFDLTAIKIPQVYYFLSACEAPMSHIATGVNSFFALSIVLQGGMSIIRGVAAAFGFNWGLGSSKTSDDE